MNRDTRLIDWDEGKFKLGDEAMLRTFLQKFQQDALYDSISAIIKHAKAKEWDLVRREAHSLRGSCGYVGAKTCQELSTELQIATQEENIDSKVVGKALNNLIEHAKELQEYLSKEFGKPFLDPDKIFTVKFVIEYSSSLKSACYVKSVPYQKVTESKPHEIMRSDNRLEVSAEIKEENKPIETENQSNFTECNSEVPAIKTSSHQKFNKNLINENDMETDKKVEKHYRCIIL